MAGIPAFPPRPRTVAACLLLVTSVLAAGCVQSADPAPTPASNGTATAESTAADSDSDADPDPDSDSDGRDGLESRLVGLTAAGDPSAFAAEHGIDYEDGRVSVVVTLREGAALPDGHDAEAELAAGGTVQASVPVAELRALAAHENVTYVRTPREPNA